MGRLKKEVMCCLEFLGVLVFSGFVALIMIGMVGLMMELLSRG
jgi:hypothetical protein